MADKAVQLTQSATAMYKGHFLVSEAEQPWMISPRERLRTTYLRSVQSVGSYWETAGAPERAAACYEKALEVDDLAEHFYQRLIICHLRLGRQAQAIEVYRRCRSVLNARLEIEPSSETRSLLDELPGADR